MTVSSPVETPSVRVLNCANCGAPLPLGPGDAAHCAFCNHDTPLPDDFRRLRDLNLRDAADHAHAEELFAKLDRPSPRLQTLARMFDWSLIPYLLVFLAPVLSIAIMCSILLAQVAVHAFGLDINPSSQSVIFAGTGVFMWAFVFVPRAIGVYAGRRTRAQATLVNLFRARPPLTPGGPALCRRCAAPLAVIADSALAHCNYCGADSAVRVQTAELKVAESDEQRVALTLQKAIEEDGEDRAEPQRLLMRELWRYTFRIGVLFGLMSYALKDTGQDDFGMNEPSTSAMMSFFAMIVMIFVFAFQSGFSTTAEDADARRALNPVPMRVAWIGPVVVWALFFAAVPVFMLLSDLLG